MINPDPIAIILSIINFLVIIWALNAILYKPIRQILIERKKMFSGLDGDIKASDAGVEEKERSIEAGLRNARATGLKEKETFLKAASEKERELLDKIARKNQEDLAGVKARIEKETEAAKSALLKEVDGFAEAISQKILGRAV